MWSLNQLFSFPPDTLDPERKEMLKKAQERDEKIFSIGNDLLMYVLYMFLVVSIATYTIGAGAFAQASNIRKILQVILVWMTALLWAWGRENANFPEAKYQTLTPDNLGSLFDERETVLWVKISQPSRKSSTKHSIHNCVLSNYVLYVQEFGYRVKIPTLLSGVVVMANSLWKSVINSLWTQITTEGVFSWFHPMTL